MLLQQPAKPPQSRYVGIDVFKGFGIWYMLLIHAFVQNVCHFDHSLFISTIERIFGWKKIALLILAMPITILAICGFAFGFAFACTVAIQTMKLVDKGNPKKILKYLLVKVTTGTLIVILNKFGHTLFRNRYFSDGHTLFPRLSFGYSADILDAVAWMGVLVPLIILLFYGLLRIKNPVSLLITFVILLTAWFAVTPTLLNLGEMAIVWAESKKVYIIKIIITKFTRGRFRLLPGLAYGFMGCMYATMLHHKWEIRKIFLATIFIFLYYAIGFMVWWVLVDPLWFQNFVEETIPIPVTIIAMSTQQWLLVLFLRTQDYSKSEKQRVRAARRTTFWRRYSLFSLTGYATNTAIASKMFPIFVGFWGESVDYSTSPGVIQWNWLQIITWVGFMWGFWEILLRIWDNYNYKFSLDWLLVQLVSLITGAKMGRSAIKPIIYGPNQYQFQEFASPPQKTRVIK